MNKNASSSYSSPLVADKLPELKFFNETHFLYSGNEGNQKDIQIWRDRKYVTEWTKTQCKNTPGRERCISFETNARHCGFKSTTQILDWWSLSRWTLSWNRWYIFHEQCMKLWKSKHISLQTFDCWNNGIYLTSLNIYRKWTKSCVKDLIKPDCSILPLTIISPCYMSLMNLTTSTNYCWRSSSDLNCCLLYLLVSRLVPNENKNFYLASLNLCEKCGEIQLHQEITWEDKVERAKKEEWWTHCVTRFHFVFLW